MDSPSFTSMYEEDSINEEDSIKCSWGRVLVGLLQLLVCLFYLYLFCSIEFAMFDQK